MERSEDKIMWEWFFFQSWHLPLFYLCSSPRTALVSFYGRLDTDFRLLCLRWSSCVAHVSNLKHGLYDALHYSNAFSSVFLCHVWQSVGEFQFVNSRPAFLCNCHAVSSYRCLWRRKQTATSTTLCVPNLVGARLSRTGG